MAEPAMPLEADHATWRAMAFGLSQSWRVIWTRMSVTPETAKAFLREVEAHEHVLIGTHLNPDGDALGSALALSLFLDSIGKSNEVLCNNFAPYNLEFLPGVDRVRQAPLRADGALGIMLDLDSWERLGKVRPFIEACERTVVIDHHVPHEAPGDLRIVDTSSPATALILCDLLKMCSAEITPHMATCLLAGIITDTGSFRFPNTTPHSLTVAADLLARGGDIVRIGEEVYQKKQLPAVRLLGICIRDMRLECDQRLAWSALRQEAFVEASAGEEHTEGLVNELLSVSTVQIAALIREPGPRKVRASLRSRGDFDVAAVAREFNGGGHRNAAGCTFETSVEEAEQALVAALRRCLESS
jgi:phosphoesterase RecJ-like protein